MSVYDYFDCELDCDNDLPDIKIIAQSTSPLGIDLLLSGRPAPARTPWRNAFTYCRSARAGLWR